MNGTMVVCAYRPHEGKEDELRQIIAEHVPLLRREGLAARRPVILLRSMEDGTFVEIFEWVSEDASRMAHENPKVLEIWKNFEKVADFLPIAELKEAAQPFAHFEPIEGSKE